MNQLQSLISHLFYKLAETVGHSFLSTNSHICTLFGNVNHDLSRIGEISPKVMAIFVVFQFCI